MKVTICSILNLVCLILISGTLSLNGIHVDDWQFWVIYISAVANYLCGLCIGRSDTE